MAFDISVNTEPTAIKGLFWQISIEIKVCVLETIPTNLSPSWDKVRL